jgi:hypothetical protein
MLKSVTVRRRTVWRMSDAHVIVGAEQLANMGGYYYDGMTDGELGSIRLRTALRR